MSTQDVHLKFDGKDELLKILYTTGNVVEYLTKENTLCPLLGSEIELEEIGKGKYGTAFSMTFPGMGKKRYVAKRTSGVNHESCLTDYEKDYEKNDEGGGIVSVPEQGYVCESETYSEYIIGVLVGELYRKKECINFIDTFDFATCKKPISYQYVFMEQIDADLQSIHSAALGTIKNGMSIVIQILFAIAMYQTKYKLVHNDLHLGNVFIEYITPTTTFDGNTLADADYFYYEIGDEKIYLPYSPYIVKIGDWGMACKYSDPMVLNEAVIDDNFGGSMPNFYTVNYDSIFALSMCIGYATEDEEMHNVFAELLTGKTSQDSAIDSKVYTEYINDDITEGLGRPKSYMWTDGEVLSPGVLLATGKSLDKYRKKPAGKGVRIGTLPVIDDNAVENRVVDSDGKILRKKFAKVMAMVTNEQYGLRYNYLTGTEKISEYMNMTNWWLRFFQLEEINWENNNIDFGGKLLVHQKWLNKNIDNIATALLANESWVKYLDANYMKNTPSYTVSFLRRLPDETINDIRNGLYKTRLRDQPDYLV